MVGLFTGSNAHFTLPPVLGALPFLLGWSMCITLIRYWLRTNREVAGNLGHDTGPPSEAFLRFLAAPEKLQWNGFHRWLDSGETGGGGRA